MKKVLFVCIENSNRSQMAQAFATILGEGKVKAHSAGSKPSGIVNPKAIKAMAELGYDLTSHDSKSVDDFEGQPFDYVVGMGCGDACPLVPAKHRIEWDIPDPRNFESDQFNVVRDSVRKHVECLLGEIERSSFKA